MSIDFHVVAVLDAFKRGFTLHEKFGVLKIVAKNCLLQCSEQCKILFPGNHPHLSGWRRRSGTSIDGSGGL